MKLSRIFTLSVLLLALVSFSGDAYADQGSDTQAIVSCVKKKSCRIPMYYASLEDKSQIIWIPVSRDKVTRDDIIFAKDWMAVSKVVQDDGNSTTLIFDYDGDGTIDAVQFMHEKSPLINKREAENMSPEEKRDLQAYFDSVMARAHILNELRTF